MELDEAIEYFNELAETNRKKSEQYTEGRINNPDVFSRNYCGELEQKYLTECNKYKQIAEWLQELRGLRRSDRR